MSAVPPVTGVYDAALLLLIAAGVSKLRRPADTATALRGVGVPVGAPAVRAAAGAEAALGVVALVVPGPAAAALVAASYAGFVVFVAVALLRDLPLATCGCFGRPDSPPSWLHVVIDAAAAAAAVTWAVTAQRTPVAATVTHGVGHSLALTLGALVVAGLASAVLTDPLARVRHEIAGGSR